MSNAVDKNKKGLALLLVITLVLTLLSFSCGKRETKINVGVINGPSGIGFSKIAFDCQNDENSPYKFTFDGSPDEIVSKLLSGELDAAALPTNLAVSLYNKTEGNIQIAAVITLGALHIVTTDGTINSVRDLDGKTIFMAGQGANPEYILRYLLKKNNVNANIEFLPEHSALAVQMISGNTTVGLLAEPFVTQVVSQNNEAQAVIDLQKEWQTTAGTPLAITVLAVRKDFLSKNKDLFRDFLDKCASSTNYVRSYNAEAAQMVVNLGIIANAGIAEKCIPNCNIVYLDGEEMKGAVNGFINVLYEFNPKSIGGSLPDDKIFYSPD